MKRLRRDEIVQPGKEKVQGDLLHVYKYLIGGTDIKNM